MRKYETMYIIRPDLEEEARTQLRRAILYAY